MPQYYNTSIKNLVYRLRKFKEILDEELANEIMQNEGIILDMIHDQLYSGVDGYNLNLQPPYAPSTIRRKIRKGQPTDRVTLKDTGDFYESLYIASDENGFYVASTDQKLYNILRSKYGNPILRLTDENLNELIRNHIRPSLTEKMTDYIKNG